MKKYMQTMMSVELSRPVCNLEINLTLTNFHSFLFSLIATLQHWFECITCKQYYLHSSPQSTALSHENSV